MALEASLLAMGFVVLCRLAMALGTAIGNFSLFAEKVCGWLMFGLVLESLPALIKASEWAQSKETPAAPTGKAGGGGNG